MGKYLILVSLLSGLLAQDVYQQALEALQQGRFDNVILLLADLSEGEAGPEVHNLKAVALARLGRFDEALVANQRARDLDPENTNYIYNGGMLYLDKNDFLQAERLFRDALQRFPQASPLYHGLAETFFRLNEFKKAERYLLRVLEMDPQNVTAYVALAKLFYALGDQQNLESTAQRAVELAPDNHWACYYYGLFLIDHRGDTKEGVRYIRKSLEVYPGFVEALRIWGRMLAHDGRWQEAAETYEKALAIDPRNRPLYYLLASTYRQLGMKTEAAKALKEYRALGQK